MWPGTAPEASAVCMAFIFVYFFMRGVEVLKVDTAVGFGTGQYDGFTEEEMRIYKPGKWISTLSEKIPCYEIPRKKWSKSSD
jgi:hypothetical protein